MHFPSSVELWLFQPVVSYHHNSLTFGVCSGDGKLLLKSCHLGHLPPGSHWPPRPVARSSPHTLHCCSQWACTSGLSRFSFSSGSISFKRLLGLCFKDKAYLIKRAFDIDLLKLSLLNFILHVGLLSYLVKLFSIAPLTSAVDIHTNNELFLYYLPTPTKM